MLNAKLLDWVFKLGAAEHANGHFAANKQFIAPLPIRTLNSDVELSLEALGRRLHDSTKALLGERHDFQSWLSDLIGAPITSLAGRTKLERADALTPAEIIEILRKNRAKLSLDPGARSFRDLLATEHRSSIEKISDLTGAIERDEAEADAAIYDLYEVSDSQRTMVDAAYPAE